MNFDNIFAGFNEKKVLILGDAMIDAYMWGEINRYSPEAPVPVVEINNHENRLGGAANVARNIKSLEGEAINKKDALWMKSSQDISKEDYISLYI